jgi:hypothetical protein
MGVSKGTQHMTALKQDDDDVLIGNRAMAEFSTSDGFPVSVSSMQKYTSPAINTGPQLIGYYGAKPTSTKGLVRAWNRSRIRPARARSAQPAQAQGDVQMEAADMSNASVAGEALPPGAAR